MPTNPRSRVLSVDDDEDACQMLSVLLKSHRIDVKCVPAAAEALLAIQEERFDLYLLDAWLPTLDGFQLCRQIRATDSRTPILFYSGAAYDADRAKGIAAGANAYVAKPDVELLIQVILDLTNQAKAAEVAAQAVANQFPPVEISFFPQFLSAKSASN